MTSLSNRHWLVDLYGIKSEAAESIETISNFLYKVNAKAFNYGGIVQISPVLGDTKKPQNNGISGLILAKFGHFTLHTFSRRGVAFMDLCMDGAMEEAQVGLREGILQALNSSVLHYERSHLCLKDEGIESFGSHVMLTLNYLPLEQAISMVSEMMDTIEMTALAGPVITLQGDGYDLIQPITESHIALHASKSKNFAMFDIFSCKSFSINGVRQALVAHGANATNIHIATRGIWMLDKGL